MLVIWKPFEIASHFWKPCTQRTQNFIGFFVYSNLFCGLNPTKEACHIKLRAVWWENKYLGGIQAKLTGTRRDLPRFAVFPLCLWRDKPLCLPPAEVMGQMEISQSVSLKHLPCYGPAWSSTFTAVRMWGLRHPLRVNSESSREWSGALSALWVHPDVGHSLYRKPILSLSY